MARVTKNILGEVRGRIGNEVRKVRNGKPYVASLPSKYTMSNEPHAVEQRNLFKINGKFSSMIYNINLLKQVWENFENGATTTYNKISSTNYKLFKSGKASDKNLIIPNGFKLPVKEVKFLHDKIEIEFYDAPVKKGEKKFYYILLIWYENPSDETADYYANDGILKVEHVPKSKVIFALDNNIKSKINGFREKIIYLASISYSNGDKIMNWSSTFAKKIT